MRLYSVELSLQNRSPSRMGPAGPIMAEKLAIATLAHAVTIVAMHKALITIATKLLGNIT